MHFSTALISAFAATLVAAHPGANVEEEAQERRGFLSTAKRTNLDHCSAQIKARGLGKTAALRRRTLMENKAKRGVVAQRDLADLNKSHHSDADYDTTTPLDTLFEKEKSCVLAPETTEGPYYVAGEFIRHNVAENEPGVPLTLDLAIYDVETCDPITDTWVQIWSCNSTGIYSGVPSGADYTPAPENLKTTFLRGFQQTDASGAAQFETLFPGHYSGRTQHVHVAVHPTGSATPRANGTIDEATRRGRAAGPYSANAQPLTANADDRLLLADLATSDPIVEYVLLGETVADGLLAWFSFGVNMTATREARVAATYYEGGGVATPEEE
ncbi:aromatic compound dioxygenase [Apiospora arundinis]